MGVFRGPYRCFRFNEFILRFSNANRSGLYWSLAEVNQHLQRKMVEEAEQIWAIAQEMSTSMRTAAYIHALNRLGEAISAKGTRDYYNSKT
ncbi:MAG: hypothetical protein F6K19_28605 [Cyanothece sp. SIO1E1]|nr:hypothetical protein [Cyanothece sp. SIO1E1]